MKKAFLVLAMSVFVMSLASPAGAALKSMKGMWGPGYFTASAPVGVRYWFAPKVAGDIGIGFYTKDISGETKSGFAFEFGLPFVLAGNETTLFFLRPGFEFASDPVNKNDNSTTFIIRGSLGVEHFFSDRFSVQVAHGLYFQNYDPGIEGSDTSTNFNTEAFGISSIGFHYYLWPSK
jgi:hypothetical protein